MHQTIQCDLSNTNLNLRISSNCIISVTHFSGSLYNYNGCTDVLYNITVNRTSQMVCLYDWLPQFTDTVVHFMCRTYDNPDNRNLYNYISSHEIIAGN